MPQSSRDCRFTFQEERHRIGWNESRGCCTAGYVLFSQDTSHDVSGLKYYVIDCVFRVLMELWHHEGKFIRGTQNTTRVVFFLFVFGVRSFCGATLFRAKETL